MERIGFPKDPPRIKMLQPVRIAAVAATMFLAAVAAARAADTVTADDTARFLAGMAPSPDSPLTKPPSCSHLAQRDAPAIAFHRVSFAFEVMRLLLSH